MSDTTRNTIPILDLAPEITYLWDDLTDAFHRVLRSRQFIMGPEVEAFEQEAADYLGVKHAVGVNSGTDALVIGLRSLGIGPGDEVITTPFSFFATAESISSVGATPVFVDIDEDTFNLDPTLIETAITTATKALMPVHLYGRPCQMDAIMSIAGEYGLKVVEDCAQSFGARFGGKHTGTIGHVGAYSFFPTKNLGGFGDGGLLATDDDQVAETARMLRAHGSKRKYQNEMIGYNSRLDSLQAAFLRVKLPYVDAWNERRREAAIRYGSLIANVDGCRAPNFVEEHVFHQYTVRIEGSNRDQVGAALTRAGIGTMVYYPTPQDQLPVYADDHVPAPISSRVAQDVLSLPIGHALSEADQRVVVDELAGILSGSRATG